METELTKMVITIFNALILSGLPIVFFLHFKRIKLEDRWSNEWWHQIIIAMLYLAAINCEIPAAWVRLKSYYQYHIVLPESFYTLNTWDRWGRVIFYLILYLHTWISTYRRIPEAVKKTLS